MKIKFFKDDLLHGITKIQNVVSSKATLPILSNVLLETTKKSTVRLYATDLDIGISCDIPVQILEEGAITIPDFKNTEAILIDQDILKKMFKMTAFAVSHEEARYILNGVLLEIEGNIIRLVATDGRRLAKIEKKITSPIGKEIKLIIPSKAVYEVSRNLKENGHVSLLTNANQMLFDVDHVLIATRIIEGDYPNYNQVIPEEQETKITLNTQEFLSAIKRANLLTTPDFQAVKFEVFKEKLVVSKITPDLGESREEVKIQYGGSEMIVGFNPHFFIEALKNINSEEISLELLGADKPGVIRMQEYLYLALPMRI